MFVGRVVTQVGGDIHVHSQAGHGVEEAVARPGADGDCLHHLVGVAGGTNAPLGNGQGVGDLLHKVGESHGVRQVPDAPQPISFLQGLGGFGGHHIEGGFFVRVCGSQRTHDGFTKPAGGDEFDPQLCDLG